MGDNISDILGLNRAPRRRVDLTKYMKNNKPNKPIVTNNKTYLNQAKNTTQKAVDYTKDKASNAHQMFTKLSTTNKILLIGGIIVLLLLIGLIVKYYRDQRKQEKFLTQPLFMTGMDKNKPHNTKKRYRYIDPNTGRSTLYIPGYNFVERNGTQYTFSFWIFIDGKEWSYRFGEWKHIFHRGTSPEEEITKLTTQLPGFWLSPKENTLNCILTTGDYGEERLTLEDIPINKWINTVVVIDHNSVSLYLDGRLHKTINLINKISPTKDAVYVNSYGGFAGKMAYLQFFDRALSPEEVKDLYREFRKVINNNIRGMFNNEIANLKLPIVSDKQKCDYMAFIKQDKDKEEYINKMLKKHNILCKNTKNKTDTECQMEKKNILKQINKDMPITELKTRLDKMTTNIKPTSESIYGYLDMDNKNQIAFLSKDEYNELKK